MANPSTSRPIAAKKLAFARGSQPYAASASFSAREQNAATSLSALHAPRGIKPSLEGVIVLAVDDDDDARELLLTLLEQRRATVLVASNARDALALFKTRQPHVIVSDIAMPNEDGYALIRRIRALSESQGGRTPAIAVTAYAGTSNRALALDAGFDRHVPKPVDLDALVEVILSLYDAHESPPRSG